MPNNQEIYEKFFNMSLDMLCVAGTNGYFKYINPAFARTLGWTDDELLSKPFLEFVHPDDVDATLAEVDKLANGALTIGFENRYRKKDGGWCWMHWNCQPDTTTGELFAVAHDISALKKATEDLSQSRAEYKEFFDFSHAMICSHDLEGTILSINPQGAGWLGYDVEAMIGNKISEFIVPEYVDGFDDYLREIRETEESQGVLALQTRTGEHTFWTYSNSLHEIDGDKKVLAYALDISSRLSLERELKEAKELAEKSVAAKDVFLANISHEIRTPMNAIVGFTDLLRSTELNADQEEFVKAIGTASSSLLVLINDLLDLSKIESGKLILDSSPFNVKNVIRELQTLLNHKAAEKGIVLEVKIDQGVPDFIDGDVTRFNQVLINLVGNAIKFTEEGNVSVMATTKTFNNRQQLLIVEVRDTGIGIESDQLETLFERFVQGSSNPVKKTGTGLGLNIAKHLAELMEGEIHVESEAGKGSTFSFLLPINESNPTTSTPEDIVSETNDNHSSHRILVAEDNTLNQKLIGKVLDDFGWSYKIVDDGRLALDAIQEDSFDLILMDLQMPHMNGYETTRAIREELNLSTPILAMTAHSLVGEKEKCLAHGMNGYMAKPFRKDELLSVAKSLIHTSRIPDNDNKRQHTYADLSILEQLANGDRLFIDEILALFKNTVPNEVDIIGQAIAREDREQIRTSAHRVKSSFKTIGASQTAQLVEFMELQSATATQAEMHQLHAELRDNLTRILNELP